MSTIPEKSASDPSPVPLAVSRTVDIAPHAKRWTRDEYHQLGEQGLFRGQHVELIHGEIIVLTPQSSQHSFVVGRLQRLLSQVFSDEFWVRTQLPLQISETEEPEPDVSVVSGRLEEFVDAHPKSAQLVVEVSFSSLEYDEQVKSHLYAAAGVPDYWVLDLESRRLIVMREPVADESADLGYRYTKVETLTADGHVAPLEKPDARLAVADMLPPVKG